MHLYYNDINDAMYSLVRGFDKGTFECQADPNNQLGRFIYTPSIAKTSSRNGSVLTVEEPVTITYLNPRNRILKNASRDCNPFFHLIEALWMLAGRSDIAPLVHYNSEMAKFSDDGETFHGAYGDRWRNYFGVDTGDDPWSPHDQLTDAIEILKADPLSRRVVVEMWSNGDLRRVLEIPTCKDVPCNLLVMFRVRRGDIELPRSPPPKIDNPYTPWQGNFLDMTVVNRSNDMLLGALGANYVHFSFLLEYIACGAGLQVGHYHQITNNLHIYTSPKEDGADWLPAKCQPKLLLDKQDYYISGSTPPPLYTDRTKFDAMLSVFFEQKLWKTDRQSAFTQYANDENYETEFFKTLVFPMVLAFNNHKRRNYDKARQAMASISPADWHLDVCRWIDKREKAYTAALADGPQPQG